LLLLLEGRYQGLDRLTKEFYYEVETDQRQYEKRKKNQKQKHGNTSRRLEEKEEKGHWNIFQRNVQLSTLAKKR